MGRYAVLLGMGLGLLFGGVIVAGYFVIVPTEEDLMRAVFEENRVTLESKFEAMDGIADQVDAMNPAERSDEAITLSGPAPNFDAGYEWSDEVSTGFNAVVMSMSELDQLEPGQAPVDDSYSYTEDYNELEDFSETDFVFDVARSLYSDSPKDGFYWVGDAKRAVAKLNQLKYLIVVREINGVGDGSHMHEDGPGEFGPDGFERSNTMAYRAEAFLFDIDSQELLGRFLFGRHDGYYWAGDVHSEFWDGLDQLVPGAPIRRGSDSYDKY